MSPTCTTYSCEASLFDSSTANQAAWVDSGDPCTATNTFVGNMLLAFSVLEVLSIIPDYEGLGAVLQPVEQPAYLWDSARKTKHSRHLFVRSREFQYISPRERLM